MPSPLLRGIMQESLLQRQRKYSDTNPVADEPQSLLNRSSEPSRSATASTLSDQSDQSSGSTAASGLRLSTIDPPDSEIPTSAFLQVPRSCCDVPLLTCVLLQAAAHIRSAMKGRKPRYIFTEEGIRLRWLFQRSAPTPLPRPLAAFVSWWFAAGLSEHCG